MGPSSLTMNSPSIQGLFYLVGLDQPLVDIEVDAEESLLARYGVKKGESIVLDDERAMTLYLELKKRKMIRGEFAGGAVGNTLHNYTILSHNQAVLLGAIHKSITVGDSAYTYLCKTSSLVNLSNLMPCDAPMGRAICFVFPEGERSFVISPGCMNELTRKYVPEKVICNASTLLLTAFLLRNPDSPIFDATMHAASLAQAHDVPIALNLGTSFLIEQDPEFWKLFINRHVNVVAMNESEAEALTGETDPFLALKKTLEWCDLVLLTYGSKGLYLGAYSDKEALRKTSHELYSKSIPEYNKYEYSRGMLRRDCDEPVHIFCHINPYQGGPDKIFTTNGAGDAALSAVLHDIAANHYHRAVVPQSPKHRIPHLTYSSISQIAKYANRVSYEVLSQNSPRLVYGLPEKEDSLEEAYWDF